MVNDGKAEIRKLNVTRDFGTWVEADAGVKSGEQVILNPPVNLVGGEASCTAIAPTATRAPATYGGRSAIDAATSPTSNDRRRLSGPIGGFLTGLREVLQQRRLPDLS